MNTDLTFVTNEKNQNLKERFEVLIKDTKFFDCLVGFFYTSGFYAITKKTLLSLNPPSIYYGYGEYHLRLVYKAMQKRLRIIEVPVIYPPRIHGQSKSRVFIMLRTYLWTASRLTSQY